MHICDYRKFLEPDRIYWTIKYTKQRGGSCVVLQCIVDGNSDWVCDGSVYGGGEYDCE